MYLPISRPSVPKVSTLRSSSSIAGFDLRRDLLLFVLPCGSFSTLFSYLGLFFSLFICLDFPRESDGQTAFVKIDLNRRLYLVFVGD